jgi:hypothetical protein
MTARWSWRQKANRNATDIQTLGNTMRRASDETHGIAPEKVLI